MFSSQFKSLKFLSDCPVCHRKQFPADIKLLEELDDSHLLHVRCKLCESSLVVMVTMGEQGMNLVGILTDLNGEEVTKLAQTGETIEADNVLKLHELLKSNKFIKEIIK